MSFQGKDFFNYARHINGEANRFPPAEQHLKQAAFRAVISRAYYGAFLEARELFNNRSITGSVHGQVKDELISRNNLLGNRLSSLLRLRHKADYDLPRTFTSDDTREALRSASKILNYIDSNKTS